MILQRILLNYVFHRKARSSLTFLPASLIALLDKNPLSINVVEELAPSYAKLNSIDRCCHSARMLHKPWGTR